MKEAFLGRQPIFNRDLDIQAYELLYRSGNTNAAGVVDEERATSQVIVNAFMEFGLERIVGKLPAFINLSREFLLEADALPFSPAQVALEIPDDIVVDEPLLKALRDLAARKYALVLDNFRYHERKRPLLELASIVKLDIRMMDDPSIAQEVAKLRPCEVKLLATKVETSEQLASTMNTGFDYFQGHFLARPKVLRSNKIPSAKLSVLKILAALQDPEAGVEDIEQLVSQDLSLSYKLLRYVNSAFFGLPKRMESIRRAVAYLGLQPIKRWIKLIALTGVENQVPAILSTAMVRAKMCELLGKESNSPDTDSFFTAGLFSALDALLGIPMERILESLPLSGELESALLRHEGRLGSALSCTLAHERGNWSDVVFEGFSPAAITEIFAQSVEWSREAAGSFASG